MVITYVDAQNQKDRGFAWSKSNYDVKQTNYNPQNQITKERLLKLTTDELLSGLGGEDRLCGTSSGGLWER